MSALMDPARYRLEHAGFLGPRVKIWWWDDGFLSGGTTEGWHMIAELDTRTDDAYAFCLKHEREVT